MAVLLLLCSCWNGSSTIGIRLLGEDEELTSTATAATINPATDHASPWHSELWTGSDRCDVSGNVSPEVTDAITIYARSHLLKEVDKLSGYSSVHWPIEVGPTIGTISCTDSSHRDGYFATIEVTPQAIAGALSVSQHEKFDGRCTWGAGVQYCFKVTTQRGQRTVLIKKLGSLIN